MEGERPHYIEDVDPDQRIYPASWRDAAIRALFRTDAGGVVCPGCNAVFRRPSTLRTLHCDHIIAYSRGGRTTWINLQLLCGPCNLAKRAR